MHAHGLHFRIQRRQEQGGLPSRAHQRRPGVLSTCSRLAACPPAWHSQRAERVRRGSPCPRGQGARGRPAVGCCIALDEPTALRRPPKSTLPSPSRSSAQDVPCGDGRPELGSRQRSPRSQRAHCAWHRGRSINSAACGRYIAALRTLCLCWRR